MLKIANASIWEETKQLATSNVSCSGSILGTWQLSHSAAWGRSCRSAAALLRIMWKICRNGGALTITKTMCTRCSTRFPANSSAAL